MNRYLVYQPYRGVTVFSVEAESGKEAMAMIDSRDARNEEVQVVDRDITWIGKASRSVLEEKNIPMGPANPVKKLSTRRKG